METKQIMSKEEQFEKLKKWLQELIPDKWDQIDAWSLMDSSLSLRENKEIIREKVKLLIEDIKKDTDYAKAQHEKLDYEEKQRIEKEIDEYNKRVYNDSKELEEYYQPVYRAINKLATGNSNLVFIKGRGGIGKSYNIRKALVLNGFEHAKDSGDASKQFFEVAGKVTEAFLYRLLYTHNGRIIWFKDLTRLLKGLDSINLLKSATETEDKRILTKSTYSRLQEDMPDQFVFNGKIIFDYNDVSTISLREDFEALISRGDYIELMFSNEDMHKVMRFVAKEDWEKEITEFIITNHSFVGINPLNLRTQWKAINTYKYAKEKGLDWKTELTAELNRTSKIRVMLYNLIGDRAVRTKDLKRLLLQTGLIQTMRTGDRKISDWIEAEEVYKVSSEERNFFVSLKQLN